MEKIFKNIRLATATNRLTTPNMNIIWHRNLKAPEIRYSTPFLRDILPTHFTRWEENAPLI